MKKYLLILIIGVLFQWIAPSCKLLKHIEKNSSDSTNVKKENIITTHSDSSNKKTEAEWWRETFLYNFNRQTIPIINSKDTTITNNNFITQPIAYIREGGKQQIIESHYNYDSMVQAKIDSFLVRMQSFNKDSKTTVLNIWQIIGLVVGGYIILSLLTKGLSNVRINFGKKDSQS